MFGPTESELEEALRTAIQPYIDAYTGCTDDSKYPEIQEVITTTDLTALIVRKAIAVLLVKRVI